MRAGRLLAAGRSADDLLKLPEVPSATHAEPPTALPAPLVRSLADLLDNPPPPPRFAVEGLIVEGVSLLVASPKSGKTRLATQLAIGVASGGRALGKLPCEQGRVLALLLEDSEWLLAERAVSRPDQQSGCPHGLSRNRSRGHAPQKI